MFENGLLRSCFKLSSYRPKISWLIYLRSLYHCHCFRIVGAILTFVIRVRLSEGDKLCIMVDIDYRIVCSLTRFGWTNRLVLAPCKATPIYTYRPDQVLVPSTTPTIIYFTYFVTNGFHQRTYLDLCHPRSINQRWMILGLDSLVPLLIYIIACKKIT